MPYDWQQLCSILLKPTAQMKRWNLIANKAEENDAKRLLGSHAVI